MVNPQLIALPGCALAQPPTRYTLHFAPTQSWKPTSTVMQRSAAPPKPEDEWAPVLALVAEQDRTAFNKLFRHFGPRLKAYGLALNSMHTSPEMAEELVQEVMIKVWQKARYYSSEKANVSTWIFAIARNCRIDYLRKMKRTEGPLNVEDLWPIYEEPDPASTLTQLRNEDIVKDAVGELPPEQASILRQIYVEGKTHSEVATNNNLPLGTVKSRVRLAINKLKVSLADQATESD